MLSLISATICASPSIFFFQRLTLLKDKHSETTIEQEIVREKERANNDCCLQSRNRQYTQVMQWNRFFVGHRMMRLGVQIPKFVHKFSFLKWFVIVWWYFYVNTFGTHLVMNLSSESAVIVVVVVVVGLVLLLVVVFSAWLSNVSKSV